MQPAASVRLESWEGEKVQSEKVKVMFTLSEQSNGRKTKYYYYYKSHIKWSMLTKGGLKLWNSLSSTGNIKK